MYDSNDMNRKKDNRITKNPNANLNLGSLKNDRLNLPDFPLLFFSLSDVLKVFDL
jgi:hypothetical protein